MTLHQRFIETAKKYGDKMAFIDRSADKRISYARALVAALLLAEEFEKFDPGFIGVMIPTSAGCVLANLGVLMSGRTPVMINYSTGAEENAEYAQKKCNFKTIITSRALIEKIACRPVRGMVFIEDIMLGLTALQKVKAALKAKLPVSFLKEMVHKGEENDDAVILFTSGSEKDPKAVELTHHNIISNIESVSERYELSDRDILLANLPLFHVFGLTVNLWAPLYHGMMTVTYANPLDFRTICEIVKDEKPTIMVGTPSFFWGYLRKSEPGDFSSIRVALCGADKCPDALREKFLMKHNMTLFEAYGATETSPGVSGNYYGMNKPGSIGKPFKDVQVKIEHYETREDCAVGEIGKIMVKGDLIMKGYFDDFEETSLHVRHGWYDTGDMGYLDEDGFLWHVGRLRRFVKIGGEMISLVKVENVLEKFLPEGVLCCVVEIPDAVKGAKIIAAVTQDVDKDGIREKMAELLPPIAMPKRFVVIEELPKMGSGKIDFRATNDMVREILAENNR